MIASPTVCTPAASDRNGTASVRSVDRALDLLVVLEGSGRPLRLTEVANLANMHKATAQRLLAVLERRGFVQRTRGFFQVGVASLPLAHAFVMGDRLIGAALPVLQELADASGLSASLFVRLGFDRVLVQRADGSDSSRYRLPIGERLPLHLGAGRVLAAALGPAELELMLAELGDMRLASGAPLTRTGLLADLERIRAQGYYIAHAERTVGMASVSAPVLDSDGVTRAALCVSGDRQVLTDERLHQLSIEVRRAALAIADHSAYG
jgi:DNA-binding IclR family transcriptional regulator